MELWPQPVALGVGSRFYSSVLCFLEMQVRDAGPRVRYGPWCQLSGVLGSRGYAEGTHMCLHLGHLSTWGASDNFAVSVALGL